MCPQGNRHCKNETCTCYPCMCGQKTEENDVEPQCTE